ncbi:MAG TPA: fibronectin type III domain-containing protein [Thermomicrobiales bacterium]|nr:fibronectin type III domain-containing protein [Thermomicrobiales bacterium]
MFKPFKWTTIVLALALLFIPFAGNQPSQAQNASALPRLELPAPNQIATKPPTLSTSRVTVSKGMGIRVTLANYPASSTVKISLDGKTVTSVRTSSSGAYSGIVTIPDATRGAHTLKAATGSVSATRSLTMVSTVDASPTTGKRGNSVRVTVHGFASGETVSLQWMGTSYKTLVKIKANSAGTASTTITVPSWSKSGNVSVLANGTRGDASVTFKVTGSPPTATPTRTATSKPTKTPTTKPTRTATPKPTRTNTPTMTQTPITTDTTVPPTATDTATVVPTETPTATMVPSQPTWPTGSTLSLTGFVYTGATYQVTLTWSPADDDVGITQYNISKDGTLEAVVNGATVSTVITGLTPATTYHFTVQACDADSQCTLDGPTLSVPLPFPPTLTPTATGTPILP